MLFAFYALFFAGLLLCAVGALWLCYQRTGRWGGHGPYVHIDQCSSCRPARHIVPVWFRLFLAGATLVAAGTIAMVLAGAHSAN